MSSGTPLLATLTKGARAAFPFISALAGSDLSPTAIVAQAKAAGFSFRNQQGFDIIAALRDNQSIGQYLRTTGINDILNPDKFGTAITSLLRNYSYRVLIRGTNDEGETVNTNVTVSSNQVLSQQQIMDLATSISIGNPGKSGVAEIQDISVQDALKKAGI